MALAPLTAAAMKINELNTLFESGTNSEKMPVLFLGHGSPMNAIGENEFVAGFRKMGAQLQKPDAVLVVSAHWETQGTYVTAMSKPRTIHDFGGFPRELFEVQYPAPGSPTLAEQTRKLITSTEVGMDHNWGLDHGSWSVIKHLYPDANVPVVQMSIDYTKPASYHYELARQLNWIESGNHQSLIDFRKQGRVFDLAIPTPEHFLPLLYVLALQDKNEEAVLFNDKPIAGALTMTSVRIG